MNVQYAAGWVDVGLKRFFARSRWERNYGVLLESRRLAGEIQDWQHEPDTFWFLGVKRGVRSYLPDFKITNKDGSIEYHEIKGRLDARSFTKIKRMMKYHPKVKLVLIDAEEYGRIERSIGRALPGWTN